MADFDEAWPEYSSDINADNRVGLLRNPKDFSCDFSARDNNRIPTNIQLKKMLSYEPIGISERPHALLRFFLDSDTIQFLDVHGISKAGNSVLLFLTY